MLISNLYVELFHMFVKYNTYGAAPANMRFFEVYCPLNIIK